MVLLYYKVCMISAVIIGRFKCRELISIYKETTLFRTGYFFLWSTWYPEMLTRRCHHLSYTSRIFAVYSLTFLISAVIVEKFNYRIIYQYVRKPLVQDGVFLHMVFKIQCILKCWWENVIIFQIPDK